MEEYSEYVGLDVDKDRIAVGVASPDRGKPRLVGIIANSKKSVLKLVGKLSPNGEVLGFCYEAGPCGYDLYRWIKETGHDCEVVAMNRCVSSSRARPSVPSRSSF